MPDDALVLAILAGVAFLAAVIDAIAGGGGLLTLPALMTAGLDPGAALATNKGQSVFGSVSALARFARSPLLDRTRVIPGFAGGIVGAVAGTLALQAVPKAALQPLVLILLVAAAAAVLVVRPAASPASVSRPAWQWAAAGTLIGAYDGFFGPGTGTLLILVGVVWWRRGYDGASADAKVVNAASNLGSLAVFAGLGQVLWTYSLAMAGGALLGGVLGAHLVVRRGQGLVRALAAAVAIALVARLAWQLATA